MSTYKRLPREKSSQNAGAMPTWLDHAYHWVETNWRPFLVGIGAVALLVVIILSISYYSGTRDDKAKVLFYSAMKVAPGTDEAVSAFEKVMAEYPRSGVAKIARLKLGNIWYERGDFDKALDMLSPLEKAGEPVYRVMGMENIAAVKMAKGDAEGSAAEYMKAYSDQKNPARGMSYFNAALAYQSAGKKEEAKKIFEELAKEGAEFTTPTLIEKSKEQLIWMATR